MGPGRNPPDGGIRMLPAILFLARFNRLTQERKINSLSLTPIVATLIARGVRRRGPEMGTGQPRFSQPDIASESFRNGPVLARGFVCPGPLSRGGS
jgi:hypothetical protein